MKKINFIENSIIKTYKKNINFLEGYDTQLFQKVCLLSTKLEKKEIKENFSLEFSSGKFNILDLNNKEYLYQGDPYYDAEYKESKFYPNIQEAISLILTEKIENKRNPKYEVDSFEYVNEYITLIEQHSLLANKKFSSIGKYFFVGTLLGIHIQKLHEKIKSKNYFIFEKSLELFRLSLFFCDYKKVAKKSNLFFAVELDELDFRTVLRKFFKNDSQYNNIVKYTLSSTRYKTDLQKLTEVIALENPLLYSFSDYLGAYARGVEYIKNGYKILNFKNLNRNFENKPILYIGPGPSFSKNIKFIKKASKSFILVGLASTLKLLSDNDIILDIVISIDASNLISRQFDVPPKYYKNSVLLVSSKIDKKIVKKLNKKNLFMIQDSIEFFEGFGILRGNSSGEIGYSLCCHFKPKGLYLIGMDVALNQKTKNTHDKSYYINTELNREDYSFSDFGELDFDKDIIKVKGNFQDEVYTTRRYLQLIYNYNQITRKINHDFNLYNLSDGAFLDGMKGLKVKNIDLEKFEKIKKSDLYEGIIDSFNKSSKINFNKQEKKEMKKDKKLSIELLMIARNCKKRNDFYQNFTKISLTCPESFVLQLLSLYYDVINPYVHLFENNKKNIQDKVNMIQLEQITKILEFYKCKI